MASAEDDRDPVKVQCVCKIKQQEYTVILTSSDLSWQVVGSKKDSKSVRISEILSVKVQKSHDKDILFVSFAQVQNNLVLKRCVVEFSADDVNCLEQLNSQLARFISDDDHKPKSLLVIVNPISGRTKGMSIYTKKVAPVFEEAGIQTNVLVTERAHHTEEILSTYDLSSINGLVLVGGDGTYHEAVNGLMRRLTKEQGLDIDDVDCTVPEIDLPIGLIPTGTGNGIAYTCYGNYDVQTAAISIAIGFRAKSNIFSLHSAGRLIAYGVLLLGFGMWGDIIHVAESRRSQGVMRYLTTMGEFAFIRKLREVAVTVKYINRTDKSRHDASSPEGVGEASEASMSSDWITSSDTVVAGMVFLIDFEKRSMTGDCTSLYIARPCSKLTIAKCFIKLARHEVDSMNSPDISCLTGQEWKVSLDNPSDPESEIGILEHIVNIDGEPTIIPRTEFHARLLPNLVTLFNNMPYATGRPEKKK